jgi:hypothetical protein
MNDNDRHQLKQMIEHNNVTDQTDLMREKKHSSEILRCVLKIIELKESHKTLLQENKPKFEEMALKNCGFLFFNYMQLYNTVLKENIDLTIMFRLIQILREIENGTCDQHEGSYKVGKILKEIYIDGTLADINNKDTSLQKPEFKPIKWNDYKNNIVQ